MCSVTPANFLWAINVLWNKRITFPLCVVLLFSCLIPSEWRRNAQISITLSLLCSGTQVLETELMEGQRRNVCTSSLLNIGRYHYETYLFHVNAQPTLTCTANIDPNNGILAKESSVAVLWYVPLLNTSPIIFLSCSQHTFWGRIM